MGSPGLVIVLCVTKVQFILCTHCQSSHSQQLQDLHRLIATYLNHKTYAVYHIKCVHVFVVLYFVVIVLSVLIGYTRFIYHVLQICFIGTLADGKLVDWIQCQWSNHDGYGWIKKNTKKTVTNHEPRAWSLWCTEHVYTKQLEMQLYFTLESFKIWFSARVYTTWWYWNYIWMATSKHKLPFFETGVIKSELISIEFQIIHWKLQ